MTDIVNLNKARKKKQTAARAREAAENRVKFGRTKAERARRQAEDEARRRHLDGHRQDAGED